MAEEFKHPAINTIVVQIMKSVSNRRQLPPPPGVGSGR